MKSSLLFLFYNFINLRFRVFLSDFVEKFADFCVNGIDLTFKLRRRHSQNAEANRRELNKIIRRNDPHSVILADFRYKLFDINVAQLPLLGVNNMNIVKVKSLARISRHLVCIENEHDVIFRIRTVIAKNFHQPLSRRSEVGIGKAFQLVPCKNNIIAVNENIAFAFGHLKIRLIFIILFRRRSVKLIFRLAEFSLHNRGGKGMKCHNLNDRTGLLNGIALVSDDDDVMLITNTGTIIRTHVDEISLIGRTASGVRVMRTGDDVKITGFTVVEKSDEDEAEGTEDAENAETAETTDETATETAEPEANE